MNSTKPINQLIPPFENAFPRIRYLELLLAGGLVLLTLVPGAPAQVSIKWTFEEAQPEIQQGGRADSIALDPFDSQHIIVASETGGLFQSRDRGASWHHIATFPLYKMGAVAFHPKTRSLVVATATDLFGSTNRGGIWLSTDGGGSWSHVPNPPGSDVGHQRFSASAISIADDTGTIYVATTEGVSYSTDNGGAWQASRPFSGDTVFSVIAQHNNLVMAGNRSGIKVSTNGAATWSSANGGRFSIASWRPGGVTSKNAFARSPEEEKGFYVVNSQRKLFYTNNAGSSWKEIPTPALGNEPCGGLEFVKAVPEFNDGTAHDQVYYGNRCDLFKHEGERFSNNWVKAVIDHRDTRDLAFTKEPSPRPLLLGTDGGLHSPFPGSFEFYLVGGGSRGYNALQITEVRGQLIDRLDRYDVYFGTQDNFVWASKDAGKTWPSHDGGEGFYIQVQKHIPLEKDSQVTAVVCGDCKNKQFSSVLSSGKDWTNPPGVINIYNPALVDKSYHVQVAIEGPLAGGLALTKDLGANWTKFAAIAPALQPMELPRLTLKKLRLEETVGSATMFGVPVLYVSINGGVDPITNLPRYLLARVTKKLGTDEGYTSYPAMNGFGGIGINPTEFAQNLVLAVDPGDSRNLIAADVINQRVMRSTDRGETWAEIPGLTALITDNGRFNFRLVDPVSLKDTGISFASAISFAEGGQTVAIGTHDNGLFLSSDAGTTWQRVPGSEQAPYITSIEWHPNGGEALVSSYGRGLWRLSARLSGFDFQQFCRVTDCRPTFFNPGEWQEWAKGIAILGGEVVAVRTEGGRLIEAIVSPGSMTSFVGLDESTSGIRITEAPTKARMDTAPGLQIFKEPIRGLLLGEGNRLLGTLSTPRRVTVADLFGRVVAAEKEAEKEVNQSYPVDRLQSVSVTSLDGGPGRVVAMSQLVANGEHFKPARGLQVLVDGQPVATIKADAKGRFSLRISAPTQEGLHLMTVRDTETKQVFSATSFVVGHVDRKEDEVPKERRHEAKPDDKR